MLTSRKELAGFLRGRNGDVEGVRPQSAIVELGKLASAGGKIGTHGQ